MGRKKSKDELKAIHAGGKSAPSGLTAFNLKLKKTEVIQNPREVTLPNGAKAVRGVGSDGTPLFRIVARS
jgi:hypothetical protein